MAGKGDSPRPINITPEEYAQNFESIFGKKLHWWETEEHKKWLKECQQDKENAQDPD